MVQIHFCSCNKHDWGYMLHEVASAVIFVLFFPVVLLYHYYSCCTAHICFFEITNVWCWDAVCLSVSLIFSVIFISFLGGFIHSIHVLYKKNNVSFHFILYLSRLSRYLWSPSLILFSSLRPFVSAVWRSLSFFLSNKWLVLNSFYGFQHTGFLYLRDFLVNLVFLRIHTTLDTPGLYGCTCIYIWIDHIRKRKSDQGVKIWKGWMAGVYKTHSFMFSFFREYCISKKKKKQAAQIIAKMEPSWL